MDIYDIIRIMEQGRIRTEVDIKYLEEHVKIDDDFSTRDTDERYVYKVSCRGVSYILKGFKIYLEQLMPENKGSRERCKQGLRQLCEIYEEYYSASVACILNPHFAKPLAMDQTLEFASKKGEYSHMYIEMLFEYAGTALDELGTINLKKALNLMKQSANALQSLHSVGVTHFDIKPANMVHDEETGVLKIIDMGSAYSRTKKKATSATVTFEDKVRSATLEYSPPEILRAVRKVESIPNAKVSTNAVDVYCWAMSFYSLLFNRSAENLRNDNMIYKMGSEEDYAEYLKLVEESFDGMKMKDPVEVVVRRIVKKCVLDGLRYQPRERPKIKEVVNNMKELEKIEVNSTERKIKLRKCVFEDNNNMANSIIITKTELYPRDVVKANEEQKKQIIKRKTVSKEPIMRKEVQVKNICNKCSERMKAKVEFECEHLMCKHCLVKYALKLFLLKKYYRYCSLCTSCKKIKKLKSLQLDCGCTKTKFGDTIKFFYSTNHIECGKCSKNHPLAITDLCLINDYISFNFTSLMLSAFPQSKRTSSLLDDYNCALLFTNLDTIVWVLGNTNIVTQLDLTNNHIGPKGALKIAEALEFNTSLKELDIKGNNIGDGGVEYIAQALVSNAVLERLDLGSNGIEYRGAKAISEALRGGSVLVELNLARNNLGDRSAKAICEAVQGDTSLIRLDLSHNKIGDKTKTWLKKFCETTKVQIIL
eukprot:TRINITY_DN15907_c0_g2_i1.p1 TRINITY_DN15907_c0_g2~~TRINITY_DN15907_c0_g2_i1.p1  ORF type:complete len:707 (+),score=142.62 TRINITY_DN15907_c0_g2_i1:39-2159(+)